MALERIDKREDEVILLALGGTHHSLTYLLRDIEALAPR